MVVSWFGVALAQAIIVAAAGAASSSAITSAIIAGVFLLANTVVNITLTRRAERQNVKRNRRPPQRKR